MGPLGVSAGLRYESADQTDTSHLTYAHELFDVGATFAGVRTLDALVQAALPHQRADGAAVVTIGLDSSGTVRLRDLYQRAPCRVLFPHDAADEPLQAVLLTTSGGLTGGDRTCVEFNVHTQASATLTTQAAEKTVPFGSRRAASRVLGNVAGGYEFMGGMAGAGNPFCSTVQNCGARSMPISSAARVLLAVESVVLGREAMGEQMRGGYASRYLAHSPRGQAHLG